MNKINEAALTATVENILKTLPISHYMRTTTIDIKLSTKEETSFFNPVRFYITIALNNILDALRNGLKLNAENIEKTTRALTYHELSHAILTPRYFLKRISSDIPTSAANIIEDERIETIFKNYYLNVDFKQNIKNIVPMRKAKDFETFLFNAVRFRYSPYEAAAINEKINNFIKSTSAITAAADAREFSRLTNKTKALYNYLLAIWNKYNPAPNPNTENANNSETDEDGSNGETSTETENAGEQNSADGETTEQQNADQSNDTFNEDDCLDSDGVEIDADELEERLNDTITTFKATAAYCFSGHAMKLSDYKASKTLKGQLLKIIAKKCGYGASETPAINGYSGKFNPKNYMTDFADERKWFTKKSIDNTGLTIKKSNEKVLNLWIDNSGSFRKNDQAVNKILASLAEVEKTKKDFRFNFVRVTVTATIKTGNDRVSYSDDDNALPKKPILDAYNRLNQNKTELNIVLFDGKCSGSKAPNDYDSYCNLAPFNNDRTIFITEEDNTASIKRVCPKARDIIEENSNYAGKLTENVLRALNLLF